MIASNNSGVWNEEGATLDFVIPPMWYQANWFRVLCVVAFLALLFAAYRLRVRQLAHQFNMTLEARVSERTRIARELHDTLLQSFQGLLLRFQSVLKILPERPHGSRGKDWRAHSIRRLRRLRKAAMPCRGCGRPPSRPTTWPTA